MGVQGQHASNLGGLLAREIGDQLGIPSYIVDPVVVDELSDVARYAGHPLFHRTSIFHALNQKAVAKRYAKEHGKKYEDLNLIVCHMGGGCSIGAHVHGSVVDTQNALDGDGPFSPERSGSLPTGQLVSLCFSGKYTAGEVRKMLAGHGGLVAYTGSNDMRDLLKAAHNGDKEIAGAVDAFHYQISKEIGAMAVVMKARWIRSSSPAALPTARRLWTPSPIWWAGSPPSPCIPARTSCWLWPRVLCACLTARSLPGCIDVPGSP